MISLLKIIIIAEEYEVAEEEYDRIKSWTVTKEVSRETDENNIYSYKEIDWDGLKKINDDIVGWIYIPDTEVDYPIVKGETNDTYLRTTFEGKKSSAGAIFMECKNASDFSDKNTILYGHNMRNGSMFHCLNKFSNREFFENHQIIQIYTPMWSRTYKVISVHTDISTGISYRVSFVDMSYEDWLDEMVSKTLLHGQDASVYKDTISLSVCHGKSGTEDRMVINLQVADDYDINETLSNK